MAAAASSLILPPGGKIVFNDENISYEQIKKSYDESTNKIIDLIQKMSGLSIQIDVDIELQQDDYTRDALSVHQLTWRSLQPVQTFTQKHVSDTVSQIAKFQKMNAELETANPSEPAKHTANWANRLNKLNQKVDELGKQIIAKLDTSATTKEIVAKAAEQAVNSATAAVVVTDHATVGQGNVIMMGKNTGNNSGAMISGHARVGTLTVLSGDGVTGDAAKAMMDNFFKLAIKSNVDVA